MRTKSGLTKVVINLWFFYANSIPLVATNVLSPFQPHNRAQSQHSEAYLANRMGEENRFYKKTFLGLLLKIRHRLTIIFVTERLRYL